MSRSCQSATFSIAASAFPRTTRASPLNRSPEIGLRLCGMAELPFWPSPKNSPTSKTSVRCRWRNSVAQRSIDDAINPSVVKTSACRSRCTIYRTAKLMEHQRQLQPEGDRLGVNAVAALDHWCLFVALRLFADCFSQYHKVVGQNLRRFGHLHRQRGVENIGGS